jgi:hypothetical protein
VLTNRWSSSRTRLTGALFLVVAGLSFPACTEVESAAVSGYEPAHIEEVDGTVHVTFTKEGADRTGVETASVRRDGRHLVVPYASLIYDAEGKTYVYTSPKQLEYVRAEVVVDRIDGDTAFLTDGPPVGTDIVTVGTAEVYGAELEIAGSH